MIDQAAIRLEFRNRLLDELEDVLDEDLLKIENRSFKPPNPPSLWMRETLIPSDQTLIANNELELLSILQYDVFTPSNDGTTEADKTCRRIGELFKATTGFGVTNEDSEEFQVTVYRTSNPQGQENVGDEWYMKSVRIFFRAYAQNHSTT